MGVPRDTITIAPMLGSEEDFAAFTSKYGDEKEYWFEPGVAEPYIRELASEFPDITFFGYIDYNSSTCSTHHTRVNIMFNGHGLTYIGDSISLEHDMAGFDMKDLKVCGYDPYYNQYSCLEAGIFESFMKSNRSTVELADFLGVSEDDLYRVSGDYD